MTREEKYNFYYQKNKENGLKNALGQIMQPRLCDECDKVFGEEVFRMVYTEDKKNICEYCTSIAKPMVLDYTEKALRDGMPPGKFRERCIDRHRSEARENQRKLPQVVKNNQKFIKDL